MKPALTDGHPVAWLAPRLLCQPVTPISVEFLPAVPALAGETPSQFADRVRSIMAARLGVPMYDNPIDQTLENGKK